MINSEDEEIIVIIGNMNADYTHSFLNSDFLFKTHLDGKCSADFLQAILVVLQVILQ